MMNTETSLMSLKKEHGELKLLVSGLASAVHILRFQRNLMIEKCYGHTPELHEKAVKEFDGILDNHLAGANDHD